jgi:hypothetical protein
MGRVPTWKLPDLAYEIGIWTHEILLRKARKGRKFVAKGGGSKRNGFGDHFLKREGLCNSLVLKRTEKQICSGYMNLLGNVFSPN